jgi:predicted ATPase/DNA-binding winged helix-turn-helix (wHTH) protein
MKNDRRQAMSAGIRSLTAHGERASEAPVSLAFGRFEVSPHRRELLADGQPVKLGGRAFDVLMALIEDCGAVISKDELMARVWSDRIVEENNLQTHISALRAALGPERGLIRTVSGRGYQFAGEVRTISAPANGCASAPVPVPSEAVPPPTNLREPVSELIGRDDDVRQILGHAAEHRLVTLTGTGGIGKTRLALAAARELRSSFADGVWVAEFSPLADPSLVPSAIAAAIGLELGPGEVSAQRLAQALSGRRLLLVLDTCEHVIAAAASVAETILRAGASVHIIATSREPLRADGEQIYPVPPLAVPAADDEDPEQFSAVRLFAARSRAGGAQLAEDRHVLSLTAAICRQLDGIPLAIELAAARTVALGIEELAARLSDRFQLLTGGRRTALPRHQTLRATLDWSYRLLTETERVVLRRLTVFSGDFSLEAASAVVADADLAARDVVDGLSSLIAKSLVAAKVDGAARFWMLDTTRAYALEKLVDGDEREQLARRHAEYVRDHFERAASALKAAPTADTLDDHRGAIDNLRAALDWAYSPDGDDAIGAQLNAAAAPFWARLLPSEGVPLSGRAGDLRLDEGPDRGGWFGARPNGSADDDVQDGAARLPYVLGQSHRLGAIAGASHAGRRSDQGADVVDGSTRFSHGAWVRTAIPRRRAA